ncbi:dephospho-CoA kinase [Propionigenium maris DSM 9537]|uniref:Dephospho-CoA kinase n=1 Tax=Propionigenium maris DSM 9537 TaxID=1123000 RepID=A0A9W6LNA3_9FUSO|nr:dephospho-CoA kinase [Propionigenium maris]GLI56388.1 dephospho-CoA kinase [Propionigenium maris DSM 9537]
MILGLTGGIASGKSTVSEIFRKLGIEVVDADRIAREVSQKEEVVDKLVELFGSEILEEGKEGRKSLDRGKLREVVFRDRESVRSINEVIHPRVIEVFEEKRRANLPDEVIIFDIPLLFEAGLEYLCDRVVVVSVDRRTQVERIAARDGSSRETAENIIDNQMSVEERERRANYIIRNQGSLEELEERVVEIYEEVRKVAGEDSREAGRE